MIAQDKIIRINELAKKQKSIGLSPQEKKEQKQLRELYIEAVKENLKVSLEQIKQEKAYHQQSCSCRHCHPKH